MQPKTQSGDIPMTDKPRIRTNADGSYRLDAWRNNASGMGVSGIDKTMYGHFGGVGKLDRRVLSVMYRYDWLARKICERPAKDATRRWINLDDKPIMAEMERLGFKKKAKMAISWARLYGGAALILIVEDGMTPADPLNPAKVKRVVDIKVADRHYLQPQGHIRDPYATHFGEPEFYVTNTGVMFHHTRVMKFTGTDLTQDEMEQELHWGGSFIELYHEAVKQFQGSMQDLRHVMTESGIGVLKIPGLTRETEMGGTIYDTIQKRINEFNLNKSIYRVAAMDEAETYEYANRQLNGLADLRDGFMTQIGGATDMGQLVLFGTSPSGLNASQEEQLATYYDMVRDVQEDDLMPAINAVVSCLNKGTVPEWEYVPLMEPSDKDKAEVRSLEADAVAKIAQYVMWPPEGIAKHLNGTGHFDIDEGLLSDAIPPDEVL